MTGTSVGTRVGRPLLLSLSSFAKAARQSLGGMDYDARCAMENCARGPQTTHAAWLETSASAREKAVAERPTWKLLLAYSVGCHVLATSRRDLPATHTKADQPHPPQQRLDFLHHLLLVNRANHRRNCIFT